MLVVIVKMREFKRVAKKTVAVKNEQVRLKTGHSSENRSESQLEKKTENSSSENYDEDGNFEDSENTENIYNEIKDNIIVKDKMNNRKPKKIVRFSTQLCRFEPDKKNIILLK